MTLRSSYNALLAEICVELGFCGAVVEDTPLHVDMFVPAQGRITADEFVAWVFRAEGWTPEEGATSSHASELRKAFLRHMGAETVDAQQLR